MMQVERNNKYVKTKIVDEFERQEGIVFSDELLGLLRNPTKLSPISKRILLGLSNAPNTIQRACAIDIPKYCNYNKKQIHSLKRKVLSLSNKLQDFPAAKSFIWNYLRRLFNFSYFFIPKEYFHLSMSIVDYWINYPDTLHGLLQPTVYINEGIIAYNSDNKIYFGPEIIELFNLNFSEFLNDTKLIYWYKSYITSSTYKKYIQSNPIEMKFLQRGYREDVAEQVSALCNKESRTSSVRKGYIYIPIRSCNGNTFLECITPRDTINNLSLDEMNLYLPLDSLNILLSQIFPYRYRDTWEEFIRMYLSIPCYSHIVEAASKAVSIYSAAYNHLRKDITSKLKSIIMKQNCNPKGGNIVYNINRAIYQAVSKRYHLPIWEGNPKWFAEIISYMDELNSNPETLLEEVEI